MYVEGIDTEATKRFHDVSINLFSLVYVRIIFK